MTDMSQQPKDNTSDTTQPPDFHGAAVIDENASSAKNAFSLLNMLLGIDVNDTLCISKQKCGLEFKIKLKFRIPNNFVNCLGASNWNVESYDLQNCVYLVDLSMRPKMSLSWLNLASVNDRERTVQNLSVPSKKKGFCTPSTFVLI